MVRAIAASDDRRVAGCPRWEGRRNRTRLITSWPHDRPKPADSEAPTLERTDPPFTRCERESPIQGGPREPQCLRSAREAPRRPFSRPPDRRCGFAGRLAAGSRRSATDSPSIFRRSAGVVSIRSQNRPSLRSQSSALVLLRRTMFLCQRDTSSLASSFGCRAFRGTFFPR